jgi:hypothetical protein
MCRTCYFEESIKPKSVSAMDKWTIKTPNPTYMSAFLNWPVNRLCGIVFNRFYRLEIDSLSGLYFRPSLWTVAPMDEGTILVYCCPSTFSLTSPPPQTKCTVYTDSVCDCGGGDVELCCRSYSAGVYTLFLSRFRTYKIATPPQTKVTSKDDIKGFLCL